MTELIQLAPTLAIPLVIVAAAMILLREVRKLAPNGKLDSLAKQVEAIDDRIDNLERQLSYISGKLDGAAETTGRHTAQPAE